MKKFVSILMLVVTLIVLSGCESQSKKIVCGELFCSNILLDELNEKRAEAEGRVTTNYSTKFYDDFNSILTDIKNNKINIAYTNEETAKYCISNDDSLDYFVIKNVPSIDYSMCMGGKNIVAVNAITKVLIDMKNDGTLKTLQDKYIMSYDFGDTDIKNISGADTMNVGIIGDVVPIDMVIDDKAVGFSKALLSEISKKCELNINLIKVNSKNKFDELNSGNIDCIFNVAIEKTPDAVLKYKDMAGDAINTESYFTSKAVYLYNKNNKNTINYIEMIDSLIEK